MNMQIVEDSEERLSEEDVDRLLDVVEAHLPITEAEQGEQWNNSLN